MASSKQYLEFILEQLSELDGVSTRAMMGEYILYVNGKIVGGIYDDRLLVKPTKSARMLLPDALLELPYEGAKEKAGVGVTAAHVVYEPDLLGRMLIRVTVWTVGAILQGRQCAVIAFHPAVDILSVRPVPYRRLCHPMFLRV